MTHLTKRREFLKQAFTASALTITPGVASRAATSLLRTPSQTRGPFYPREIPLDSDNDLTRVQGQTGYAKGIITDLFGQIRDDQGKIIARARVEIWQCDANGRYHHAADRNTSRALDERFQGYGQFTTGDDGAYRFRTIRPVPYPGRTPHIHFSVSGPGFETISTQMYVQGELGNRRDSLYNSIRDRHLRDSVTVELTRGADDPAVLEGTFHIVIAANG